MQSTIAVHVHAVHAALNAVYVAVYTAEHIAEHHCCPRTCLHTVLIAVYIAVYVAECLYMQATAFKVFQLKPPTPEQPFIKGLLDPCTNSLLAPNIPAEKLYDKEVIPPS